MYNAAVDGGAGGLALEVIDVGKRGEGVEMGVGALELVRRVINNQDLIC